MTNMTSRPETNNSSYRTYENIEPESPSKSASNKRTVKRNFNSSESSSSGKSTQDRHHLEVQTDQLFFFFLNYK